MILAARWAVGQKVACIKIQKWLLFWILMHHGRGPDKKGMLHNK
jgi:hypothetical protein